MPNAIDFSVFPLHSLTPKEQELVRACVDIAYFESDEVIIETGTAPSALYFVIKGQVAQMEGASTVHIYGPQDSFDGRALIAGRSSHRFIAREEVLAYVLDKSTVQTLIANNTTFSALLFSSLGEKLRALSQQNALYEMQSLMLSRVDSAILHSPHYVNTSTPVTEVARLFHAERISHVLVRDDASSQRLGIFSTTDLPIAIDCGLPLEELPVGQLAKFDLIMLRPEQHMGEALTTMLRHRIHRIVVSDGTHVYGVIESLDVFSYLSNHSHLILTRIGQATTIDALQSSAAQTTKMVQQLHANGIDVGLIGRLVQQVNGRLFERAWEILAPQDLVQNSCLIVMGSEGRGEQLLKTDQDNGLILRDGYAIPKNIETICEQFAQALERFDYPPCPGNVMMRNPDWRMPMSAWQSRTRKWLARGDEQDLIDLAIFMDAQVVAGDPELLMQARDPMWQLAAGNDILLSRFAASTLAFGDGDVNWLTRLFTQGDEHERLHIKKMGIFPIVQGVRSLALAQRIQSTSTVDRIEDLVQQEVLPRRWGDNLINSLHFFMDLRLKEGLNELAKAQSGSGDGTLDILSLSSLERDLLKDALGIVKRFKALMRQRFRLYG